MIRYGLQPVALLLVGSLLLDPTAAAAFSQSPTVPSNFVATKIDEIETQALSARAAWVRNYVQRSWDATLDLLKHLRDINSGPSWLTHLPTIAGIAALAAIPIFRTGELYSGTFSWLYAMLYAGFVVGVSYWLLSPRSPMNTPGPASRLGRLAMNPAVLFVLVGAAMLVNGAFYQGFILESGRTLPRSMPSAPGLTLFVDFIQALPAEPKALMKWLTTGKFNDLVATPLTVLAILSFVRLFGRVRYERFVQSPLFSMLISSNVVYFSLNEVTQRQLNSAVDWGDVASYFLSGAALMTAFRSWQIPEKYRRVIVSSMVASVPVSLALALAFPNEITRHGVLAVVLFAPIGFKLLRSVRQTTSQTPKDGETSFPILRMAAATVTAILTFGMLVSLYLGTFYFRAGGAMLLPLLGMYWSVLIGLPWVMDKLDSIRSLKQDRLSWMRGGLFSGAFAASTLFLPSIYFRQIFISNTSNYGWLTLLPFFVAGAVSLRWIYLQYPEKFKLARTIITGNFIGATALFPATRDFMHSVAAASDPYAGVTSPMAITFNHVIRQFFAIKSFSLSAQTRIGFFAGVGTEIMSFPIALAMAATVTLMIAGIWLIVKKLKGPGDGATIIGPHSGPNRGNDGKSGAPLARLSLAAS